MVAGLVLVAGSVLVAGLVLVVAVVLAVVLVDVVDYFWTKAELDTLDSASLFLSV